MSCPTPVDMAYLEEGCRNFHQVMGYLRDMQMEHGTCQPRSRMACTHCNARDALAKMMEAYRGPRVIPAGRR